MEKDKALLDALNKHVPTAEAQAAKMESNGVQIVDTRDLQIIVLGEAIRHLLKKEIARG